MTKIKNKIRHGFHGLTQIKKSVKIGVIRVNHLLYIGKGFYRSENMINDYAKGAEPAENKFNSFLIPLRTKAGSARNSLNYYIT